MAGYKPPYTSDEQKKILRYIIDSKGYYSLRGRRFWQEMVESGTVERTWQSAKEHFLKQLYPQVHNPRFQLSDEEIQLIKTGYIESGQSSVNKSNKTNASRSESENTKTVDLTSYVDSSDEELEK
ncbi:hypothetical protein ILUMI_22851 [Ignelater luminosus]|uniref:Telomeric repeat-binding factor 2-interacting protein 1 n=1 Tax=Ignelater luminosus TaxID=2038154 RepID=A0A8K0G2G3_IGNLU|nr:hypothetical protein ILUMI_22851 [Ignelater luminosus]